VFFKTLFLQITKELTTNILLIWFLRLCLFVIALQHVRFCCCIISTHCRLIRHMLQRHSRAPSHESHFCLIRNSNLILLHPLRPWLIGVRCCLWTDHVLSLSERVLSCLVLSWLSGVSLAQGRNADNLYLGLSWFWCGTGTLSILGLTGGFMNLLSFGYLQINHYH
jgi:hypothetical protein